MAKSSYGITPWGAWFLRMLEAYNSDGRVSRGKSYANTGKVDSLTIAGNKVAARVAGHYDPWYYITLTFPPVSAPNRKKIEKILASYPADCLALENGVMTERLVTAFEAKDIRFIPRRQSLLESDCTCPDSARLCKHIAAVLYILSKEIDNDPRLLFQLAGLDLTELRKTIGEAAETTAAQAEDTPAAAAHTTTGKKNSNITDTTAAAFSAPTVSASMQDAARSSSGHAEIPAAGNTGTARKTAAKTEAAAQLQYEHPVPLSLRRSDEEPAETPTALPAFPIEESFFPLITAMLPPTAPFYSGDLPAAFKELYHRLAARQTEAFDRPLEQHIRAIMATPDGSAAAVLCGSNRLLYTPVRMDTAPLPRRKEKEPSFPLHKSGRFRILLKCPNGTEAGLTLAESLSLFHGIVPAADSPAEVKALYAVLTLGERLIGESALIPAVFLDKKTQQLSIFWKPLTSAQTVSDAIDRCALMLTEGFFPQILQWGKRYCTELLLTALLTEYVRSAGFMPSGIRAAEQEIAALFFRGAQIDTRSPGNHRLPAAITQWLAALQYSNNRLRFRLILEEAAQADFKISAEVSRPEESDTGFVPFSRIKHSAETGSKTVQFVLSLSAYLPQLMGLLDQKWVPLTQEETALFLRTAAPLLSRFGIEVIVPKSLQRTLKPKPVFQIKKTKGTGAVQSYLSLESLTDYDLSIMLGDTVISIAQFKKLMKHSTGLVKFNDRYLLVDPEYTAHLLETMQDETPTIHDIIQGTLTGNTVTEDGAPFSYSLFRETDTAIPAGLQAELRPYQKKGFQWLYSTIKSGFGCLLGDDMGLGKTLQVITLILKLKEQGFAHSGILIAAPASLLPNWEHEIKKFAPDLRCAILHGQGRRFSSKADIHITTYQTLQRDAKKLSEKTFDCLIIDEAQAVKNTQTKNAQALRQLHAASRIAMTGTPVENSLEDMRALFDFIIPGYLGSAETFRKKWRIPIELHGDTGTAENFQKITAPFLLRRLKTDPAVISDLPEKVISPQYCRLSPEQAALYESLIQTQLGDVLKADGDLQRNALMLKLLTALKQVCNHPHVYDTSLPADTALSGKTAALMQLLAEILETGEKVLIFSQYTQTLFLLQQLIRQELNTECLLLHGQMPLHTRKAAVDTFQTDPSQRIFLISLKAGGTGLNLTAASRVIHFDLWYNPAIEDQATDRAFRIGQHKTVFVSRFICAGTFEEKIDAMIQKKRQISRMTVKNGESWIAKMSNEELTELFS